MIDEGLVIKKTKIVAIFFLTLFCLFQSSFSVNATQIIFIRSDGSIEGTNKIYRSGNTYIFSGDIKESYGIIVEKNNIKINGQGYILQSKPRILPVGSWDFGIELSNKTTGNVTIENLKILDFNIGIYVWTSNNIITKNNIQGSNVGIFLAACPNTITHNYLENNIQGVFLGPLPSNHTTVYNRFYHNTFVNNTWNVYDCECDDPKWKQQLNIWDNGNSGNYWDDYFGEDLDNNGIGDIVYSVTEDDVDFFPLMTSTFNFENESFLNLSIEQIIFLVVALFLISVIIIYLIRRKNSAK